MADRRMLGKMSAIKFAAIACGMIFIFKGAILMAGDGFAVIDEAAFFGQLDLERSELKAVRKAVKRKNWDGAKAAWAKHLEERKSPTWIWSHRDREKIESFLSTHGNDLKRSVKSADKVMRREFNMQSIKRTLKKDIAWSSKEYEKEWGNVLNRHHFWKTLGLAWWKTGDKKYAEDWAFMLRDWIQENPVKQVRRGPWRSLEAGSRSQQTWFDAMNLFMDAPAFDAETKYMFTRSLIDHAHLLAKKNKGFRKGNWQQAEATGLASIGIMFPELKEAASWRKQAFSLLQKHMTDGVYPDGAQCELTPGYHYWMTIGFIKIQTLARKNGYKIPGLTERHEKMFEFLMQVAKPDRWCVPLGDAGAGKDIKMVMGLGALTYKRPDMRYLAIDKVHPDWIWMFPPEKLAEYAELLKQEPTLGSHMMPHAKYGVMRTGWQKDDRSLLFDCAPWGGFHSHQDRLQVTLYSGRDLLVDSGQCHYDEPLARGYYRKAKAHNVLMVDEKEQPDSDPKVLSWNVKDRVEFASGRIKKKGLAHQRSVLFVKPDYWVVVDHVTGKGAHTLTRLFHLPDVDVTKNAHSVQTGYKDGDNLWIGCVDGAAIDMRKGWWRKAHSVTPQSPVAAFVSKQKKQGPTVLCTVLVPFAKSDEIPTLERLKSEDPSQMAIKVSFKDGRTDLIAIASEKRELKVGKFTGTGVALCARSDKKGATFKIVDTISPGVK
jgi:hypothetical protein